MQRALAGAGSVADLQSRILPAGGPLLTPADRALPLPQLRRQLEACL